MNAELEALLKAYDAFLEARGAEEEEEERLFALYESRLEEVSLHTSVSKEALHRAVKKQYLRWVQANARPTTLPPTA